MIPLGRARKIAEQLALELAPACERIEIAGSVRRGASVVKDVELVTRPRGIPCDLLGQPLVDEQNELDRKIAALLEDGLLAPRETGAGKRMGKRYKALRTVRTDVAVDLFIVMPPAEFGAIHAIRTGPWEYSRELVTACKRRGLDCVDGRLVDAAGRTIETPTEHDFFRECGVEWIPPEARQ